MRLERGVQQDVKGKEREVSGVISQTTSQEEQRSLHWDNYRESPDNIYAKFHWDIMGQMSASTSTSKKYMV